MLFLLLVVSYSSRSILRFYVKNFALAEVIFAIFVSPQNSFFVFASASLLSVRAIYAIFLCKPSSSRKLAFLSLCFPHFLIDFFLSHLKFIFLLNFQLLINFIIFCYKCYEIYFMLYSDFV